MKLKLVAVATALLALTACSDTKKEFITKCTSDNSISEKTCQCIYSGLEKKYSESQIMDLVKAKTEADAKKLDPNLMKDFVSTTMSCAMSEAFNK